MIQEKLWRRECDEQGFDDTHGIDIVILEYLDISVRKVIELLSSLLNQVPNYLWKYVHQYE